MIIAAGKLNCSKQFVNSFQLPYNLLLDQKACTCVQMAANLKCLVGERLGGGEVGGGRGSLGLPQIHQWLA